MYPVMLSLHVLAATIWTGGHLVLFFGILLPSLRTRNVAPVREFENRYEKIGIPALFVLIATGLWLSSQQAPFAAWFGLSSPISRTIVTKLSLLFLTVVLAAHARLRIIPKLNPKNFPALAGHITAVTLLSVLFVLTGLWNRFGGLI